MKLSEVFSPWEVMRMELIESVRLLTQSQLDWIPQGGKNSIGDLLRHISETELWWLGVVVLQSETYRDLTRELAPDIGSIITNLGNSHELVKRALGSADTENWNEEKFSPRPTKNRSLKWIAWHTFEHEARHRGQIFMMMRLQGITPPDV